MNVLEHLLITGQYEHAVSGWNDSVKHRNEGGTSLSDV